MNDWDEIRHDFPALEKYTYFLSASGGPMPRPVYEKAIRYYREVMEDGDSRWEENVEHRERIRCRAARFIGAESEGVEFVPSTAAGMNLIADLLSDRGDVIATTLEFPDSTLPWLHRRENSVRWVSPDETGAAGPERFLGQTSPETATLVCSHVQFSNGFRQNLPELGQNKGAHLLVVNATQSIGAFRIDTTGWGIDALCCNSYKWLLAGYGCGLLYLSEPLRSLVPPGVGWFAVQDRDLLANHTYHFLPTAERFNWGSPSFPTIFALGAALAYLEKIGIDRIERRILTLNRLLTDRLAESGFRVLSPLAPEHYRSGATLVALPDPETATRRLAEKNILCTQKPEGIRIATHFFNNEADIDLLVRELNRISGKQPGGRRVGPAVAPKPQQGRPAR